MKTNAIRLALLLSMLLSACRGSGVPDASDVTREYVGKIPGTEFFIAIVVNPDGNVLAYVCDGMGVDFLFRGAIQPGDPLLLNTETSEARLEAVIEGDGYQGVLKANGKEYPFTTVPANDYGGLYRLTGLSETEAEGMSQAGSLLQVNLLPDRYGLHIEVTTVDGESFASDHFWTDGHNHTEPSEYSEHWMILLNDGRGHGGRILSSFKPGTRTIDPICIP